MPVPQSRLLAPAQVAELLAITVDEVIALAQDGSLRGVKVGAPARWRIEQDSVQGYLDDQAEQARLHALWEQSNLASFPELWGTGSVRHPD